MDQSQRGTSSDVMLGIREEFAAVLDIPAVEVGDDADFYDDLEGDSLQKLELAARIEERFTVKLTDEEASRLRTVMHFTSLVTDRARS